MNHLRDGSTLDPLNIVDEVAEFAKVSTRTVHRAIAAGRLVALRAEGQIRIRREAVWDWLGGATCRG